MQALGGVWDVSISSSSECCVSGVSSVGSGSVMAVGWCSGCVVSWYLRRVPDSCALGSSYPGGSCCQIRTAGELCVLGIIVTAVVLMSISRSMTCTGVPLIAVFACRWIGATGSLFGI